MANIVARISRGSSGFESLCSNGEAVEFVFFFCLSCEKKNCSNDPRIRRVVGIFVLFFYSSSS